MGQLDRLKVLVVEDNADMWKITSHYLRSEGAEPVRARDGDEAIQHVMNGDFEVVLMDLQLPNMNGLEATRELRKRGFDKPILALTAHSMHRDVKASLDCGCDDHLAKPIDSRQLIRRIVAAMLPRTVH